MRNKKAITLAIAPFFILLLSFFYFIAISKLNDKSNNFLDNAQSFLSCAKEGERVRASGAGFPVRCCTNLKAMYGYAREKCDEQGFGDIGVCSSCGNGICEAKNNENKCNCPEDCTGEESLYVIYNSNQNPTKSYLAYEKTNKFSATVLPKQEVLQYEIGIENTALIIFDDLVIQEIVTGNIKKFDSYKELSSENIEKYLLDISAPTQYTLYPEIIRWSDDNRMLYGKVNLFSSADPPAIATSSYFSIDTNTWKIITSDTDIFAQVQASSPEPHSSGKIK